MIEIRRAYRFALEPNSRQKLALAAWAPALRFVWNWMLAQRRDAYKASEGRVRISYYDQTAQLPAMKAMIPWLTDLPAQPLQQCLKDLDTAYARFFAGLGHYPRFKCKQDGAHGIRWPQGIKLNGRCIFLSKLGWVKARFSQTVVGTIKNATVRHDGSRWFVSLQAEITQLTPAAHTGPAVGLDAGVTESIALSDGRRRRLPVATAVEERRQRLLAQRLSRCVPGSRRHAKAKRRRLVFRRKILNRVNDSRHKLTTELAKNHGLIVVEALAVKALTASARGTIEAPGTRVRQKAGLNRALLAQGHGETIRQLDYKSTWLGGKLRKINPAFTSQTCPKCGHVSPENRPSRAVFRCVTCNHTGHADNVAAQNILAAGLAVSARGGCNCAPNESGTIPKQNACPASVLPKRNLSLLA